MNARAELKKIPIKDIGTDKESVISDSYGESFNDSHSPDPHDYYSRYPIEQKLKLENINVRNSKRETPMMMGNTLHTSFISCRYDEYDDG